MKIVDANINIKLLFLAIILFLIPSTINAGVTEDVKYEGYLNAYEGVLNDLLGQKYTSEGYEVLKKEAYLLTGSKQNYTREERAYYYKNGQVGNVTLILNMDPWDEPDGW